MVGHRIGRPDYTAGLARRTPQIPFRQSASPTIPGTLLARVLHDEFTVENVLNRDGRITGRNLQVYAPDGTAAIDIQRDAGEKTPRAFMLYERVSDSTMLWWER